jgi:hypothetical protein
MTRFRSDAASRRLLLNNGWRVPQKLMVLCMHGTLNLDDEMPSIRLQK